VGEDAGEGRGGVMRILRFEAENVKRLKAVAITPAGNVVQITGANGSGKSSVLDAILWALAGVKGIDPEPIRQGETSARIRLDLGEVIVTRKFTHAGSTLTVEADTGAKFPSPQKLLDALLGALSADPLAFTRLSPTEQRKQLGDLVGLSDELAALDAQRAEAYATRTEVGREVRRLEGALASFADVPADAASVDVAELMGTLAQVEASQQAAYEWDNNVRAVEAGIREADARIASLQAEIEAARQYRADCTEALVALKATPVVAMGSGEAIRAQIVDAQRVNALAEKAKQRDALAAELAQSQAKVAELTAAIASCDEAKQALVQATALPLDGLAFADDGLTYQGVPLAQASSAEQLRVSTAIAMALNPTLRVIRIKDGSLLDESSLALLEQMAEAHDFQVWIERVDTSGTVGVVMEDGTARLAVAA
jgi:DNA repair exonuclease SbcCD ATPase subunit